MTDWAAFFGRLHPLVLHLPIGLLVGLAAVELVALVRRSSQLRSASAVLAWLAAASAVLAAASGWTLSHEDGYGGDRLGTHQNLGIAVAGGSVLIALLQGRKRLVWTYRVALLATVGVLLPGAHLGATITHGEEFLTAPLRGRVEVAAQPDSTYTDAIAPIFAASCASCHGATKHKGGLSLHTPEAILAGGENGAVIVAGEPARSEMLRRLRLPLDDDDHMPPENKPQPKAEEVARIEVWIAAGAPFGPRKEAPATEPEGPPPAPAAAITALLDALVHVEAVEKTSNLLWIDFAAAASRTTDAEAAALLEPVREQTAELSLARTGVTDATLALAARMPDLRRLDLRGTAVTDAGLALLAGHAKLEDLVLAQTKLTDAAVEHLLAMPALQAVWLWRSGASPEAIERLRRERPELSVDAGDTADSSAAQVEEKVELKKPAPAPTATTAIAPFVSLTPVNTTCPVSGSPVDPAYTIVFRGKVVGFCCAKCPGAFWADPAKFESKLP